MSVRHRPHAAVLLVAAVLTLSAGCGGSDDETAGANPASSSSSSPVPGLSPEASSSSAASGGGAGECGSAQLEIQAGVGVTGYVTSVEVPSCAKALVKTSLTSSENDVLSAVGICGIGTTQAAPQGVASVSVLAADGTELAAGTNSADCKAVTAG